MTQDRNDQDLMGYEAMAQEALRGVVRASLQRAASPGGLPGQHHFYITFKTRGLGVSIPPELAERYPDEMTIVLQHQYWDLTVGDNTFGITLKFGGQPKKLSAPYAAVTRFYDPSVQFLLQFEAPEGKLAAAAAGAGAEPEVLQTKPRKAKAKDMEDAGQTESQEDSAAPGELQSDEPKIVSLDNFRKK